MINRILIILALLLGLLPAQAQFQSVTTTANGTLHSPTTFWAQNSLAIANALAANPGVPVVRRASEGDFIGEGVWLAANVSELTMSPADYSGTLINAGPGVIELYNDQPNLVATVRPGETISYTFEDDDNDITITSRWSPAPLPTTNGLLARTGDGTTAARTITAGDSNIIWTNGSGLSGNPTSTINATQTGNRTYAANLTVQGNTTLGDASGDTVTINAATINASNANATDSNSIANVGTLDGRYNRRGMVSMPGYLIPGALLIRAATGGNTTSSVHETMAAKLDSNSSSAVGDYALVRLLGNLVPTGSGVGAATNDNTAIFVQGRLRMASGQGIVRILGSAPSTYTSGDPSFATWGVKILSSTSLAFFSNNGTSYVESSPISITAFDIGVNYNWALSRAGTTIKLWRQSPNSVNPLTELASWTSPHAAAQSPVGQNYVVIQGEVVGAGAFPFIVDVLTMGIGPINTLP
jgi:hypothetical protein